MSAGEGSRTAIGLALLALAAGLAALLVALGPFGRDGSRGPLGASTSASAALRTEELGRPGELARRVEELERRLALVEDRPVRSTAAPSAELAARLAALEAALEAEPEAPAPLLEGADELLAALRALATERPHERMRAYHLRRAELIEAFLERHAAHPAAPGLLEDLVDARYRTGDPASVEQALERFAPRVDLAPWRVDGLYGNCYANLRRFDEARQRRARVRDDPSLPEPVRADAQFWYAHTFEQEGRLEDALAEYEHLIATHQSSSDPSARSKVEGARGRIELVRGRLDQRR